jgi:hypothetical protein
LDEEEARMEFGERFEYNSKPVAVDTARIAVILATILIPRFVLNFRTVLTYNVVCFVHHVAYDITYDVCIDSNSEVQIACSGPE